MPLFKKEAYRTKSKPPRGVRWATTKVSANLIKQEKQQGIKGMKLGFVFDTRFTKYGNDYFSMGLSKDMLINRYLNLFDEMVVVGRYKEVKESPIGKFNKLNCEQIKFKCYSNDSSIKRLLNFRKDTKYIREVLKSCDAVVCRGWRGTILCKKLSKPYLVEVVNCPWDSYWNHGLFGKIVAPIMFCISRTAIWNAPYVIYVTNEFLQKRYPTKGKNVAISNVALQKSDSDVLNNRIDKILNSKTDKIVIGTAAAVDVPFKGQRFIIKALAKLKEKGNNDFVYYIVGSGDFTKLRHLAEKKGVSDRVRFGGNIPHNKVFEWFDLIDVYVQPSLQEGLPRAMIEAMSRGLPCYGTRTGGIPELIDKKCVCNNNRFISNQFVKFFESYNKDDAITHAKRNYNEAKKYEADILERKREDFIKMFYSESMREKND